MRIMQAVNILSNNKAKTVILDIALLISLYLVPTISHLLALPIYYIEPMRLMLFVAILYTNRLNAVFIAVTLPLFSFAISSHPVFIKTILISAELLVNTLLFYYLLKITDKPFVAGIVSIITSKVFYYTIKYFLLSTTLLGGSLVSTPLIIQAIVTLVLSGLIFLKFFADRKSA
jgi:hypothetical protein